MQDLTSLISATLSSHGQLCPTPSCGVLSYSAPTSRGQVYRLTGFFFPIKLLVTSRIALRPTQKIVLATFR